MAGTQYCVLDYTLKSTYVPYSMVSIRYYSHVGRSFFAGKQATLIGLLYVKDSEISAAMIRNISRKKCLMLIEMTQETRGCKISKKARAKFFKRDKKLETSNI